MKTLRLKKETIGRLEQGDRDRIVEMNPWSDRSDCCATDFMMPVAGVDRVDPDDEA
jgi:hypothetical protein